MGFLTMVFCLCLIAGSGFVSQDLYIHGFFSASIKLPTDYTAGVVVAFYVSSHVLIFTLVFHLLYSWMYRVTTVVFVFEFFYFSFACKD